MDVPIAKLSKHLPHAGQACKDDRVNIHKLIAAKVNYFKSLPAGKHFWEPDKVVVFHAYDLHLLQVRQFQWQLRKLIAAQASSHDKVYAILNSAFRCDATIIEQQ